MDKTTETHIRFEADEINIIANMSDIINELVDSIDGDEAAQINGGLYDYDFLDQVCMFFTDLKQQGRQDIIIKVCR